MVQPLLSVRAAHRRETCLVLAVVLLGVAQHPVAESQHVLEVSIALVSQILQPQYWTITLICERSLENTKDLERQKEPSAMGSVSNVLVSESSKRQKHKHICCCADLGEDVLFPHEFLSLSVGCRSDHRQNVLAVVRHHTHKEDQIFEEFCHKPEKETKHSIFNTKVCPSPRVSALLRLSHLLSF